MNSVRQSSQDSATFTADPDLVMWNRRDTPLAERYRHLRLRLDEGAHGSAGRQLVVITSAIPGEGKTTTAVNLALAHAEIPNRVTLLVDADLRRPSLTRYVARKPRLGLADVLEGAAQLDDVLIAMAGSRLWVLPAGTPRQTPTALLQTETFASLITELRSRFDRIVIDTPPTLAFADAAIVAPHGDGALLVVRAGTTTKPLIQRARGSLAGSCVLGVVLNDVASTIIDRYYSKYDELQPGGRAYAQRAERRD